jgi:hypothetical protein
MCVFIAGQRIVGVVGERARKSEVCLLSTMSVRAFVENTYG